MEPNDALVVMRINAVVTTLMSAVESLFRSHPNPAALYEAFSEIVEKDASRELGEPTPDAAQEAGEHLRKVLLSTIQSRCAR